MIRAVADTHAAIWYLSADSRLSAPAKTLIETAAQAGDEIAVSSITLVEMIYLVEKGRIPAERFTELVNALDDADSIFVEVPVALPVAHVIPRVSGAQIPDMPDRIIAATALYLGVPVISRDGHIQASSIETIW